LPPWRGHEATRLAHRAATKASITCCTAASRPARCGTDQLRIGTLVGRVERGEVDEVILATSPTLEGEATAHWLAGELRGFPVRITRIATGVPAGSDIEYADEVTMARALEGRREL